MNSQFGIGLRVIITSLSSRHRTFKFARLPEGGSPRHNTKEWGGQERTLCLMLYQ